MSEPIPTPKDGARESRLDTEALDWLEKNGASLVHASQPDMGNRNWSLRHPALKMIETRAATVRGAILIGSMLLSKKEGN